MGLSNIFLTVDLRLQRGDWEWMDVARGHLDGIKGVKASLHRPKVGFFKWLGYVADTYKLYNQAHAVGFFQRYPGFVRPVQIGAIGLSVYNLYAYMQVKPGHIETENQVWNWTPKVQALGTLALTVIEFKEKPMKATSYFFTAAIGFITQTTFFKYSQWVAKGNLFWNVGWPERGGMAAIEICKRWSKR